ncbi:serine threonine [Micractinium conductrix]|uniref:Serine threonine n=1 Tax=Micractinium conductrix TaxID=554055 RepID=A0A2P6VPQ9_9CHLO|nr:serine threonine [Micractinium conductrix]|eukprot:PSC76086.1 serine threonine [Micractinium conductrix]
MSRLPALALYLWLLAAGARAACSPGYLKLDLLSSTGGASCGSTPLALCLASFRVDVTDGCTVSVTPLLAAGVYVPGLWSTNPGASYAKPLACPDGAGTAVAAAAPLAAADVQAAIELALERRVYGASYELGLSGAWLNGTLTLTTAADSCSLKYAISEVSTSDYAAQISEHAVRVECLEEGGALVLGTECQTNTATNCPPGARPVTIPSGKVCAACRAGTFSATGSNAGCDACDAGKAAGSVGAAACDSPCAAGSYSLAGSSTCLPCAPGTYQKDAGKSTCSPCPYRSYARRPGATQCVRCVGGVAKCVVGADAGCTPDLADAPSEGYHVLSLTTPATLPSAACALPSPLSFGTPPLFGTCTLAAGTPTKLSLYVDQWCGVEIYPMADAACAEPAAAYWSSMRVKAHYVAPGLIAGTVGAASSSYLLSLMPTTGSVLTLSYWPATTAAANAAAALGSSTVCTGTVDVVGGQVAGLPDSPATCPAGSYTDSVEQDGCRPCPVGAVCDASATQPTTCLTDQYQPYLGQPAGACLTCNASTVPRYTSAAGDDYCTVDNGQQYDEETTACVSCPAGTYRTVGREDLCTPCLPGYYSPAGASDCTICPLNQFSPIYGLAERTTGDKKCLYCPTGSVAKTEAGTVGQQGSTYCDSCDPGTVSAIVAPATYATCAPCTEGYYRSGDASASNNACQPIPVGWKEKARSGTTYDRTQIELCSRGEVSSWSSGARVPSDAQSCQACLGNNKYAPRLGMAACQPCRAGYFPDKSALAPGNDKCSPCSGNTYRPASSASATCLVCTAGREVDGSGNTACLPCLKGSFMTDNIGGNNTALPAAAAACSACPPNTYQPRTGQTRCLTCPAGTTTMDEGSTECTPCALGYWAVASSSCLPAPAGTYVNTTGATSYTSCPVGTFSAEEGSDACDICVAGTYSNMRGSKSCKTCPAGTYSRGAASTCVSCKPGYWSPAGSGSCTACKSGTYSKDVRSASCSPCPLGYQCATMATQKPQPCPRGRYSSKEGNRLCTPCPVNTFQSTTGRTNCKACPRGYSTRGMLLQLCDSLIFAGRAAAVYSLATVVHKQHELNGCSAPLGWEHMKRQLGEALKEYGYLQCATMKLAALGVQGCEERPLASCAACDGAPVHINMDFNFSLCHNAKCGTSDVQLPHYLRGEAVNQLLLESSGAAGTAAAADTPACSDFDAARVLGRTSKSHHITAVGVTMCRHSVVAHVMDIGTGERYIYDAIMLYMLMVQHALQVVVVWYDINCKFGPWFKRWAVAKAVLLPVLQCAAAVLFPLPVWHRYAHRWVPVLGCTGRTCMWRASSRALPMYSKHEPAETLWAWLGALGIITQYMTQRNRWGRIERALQLWNQRQADRIVPLLCSMQASTEQAAAAASHATAATVRQLERVHVITHEEALNKLAERAATVHGLAAPQLPPKAEYASLAGTQFDGAEPALDSQEFAAAVAELAQWDIERLQAALTHSAQQVQVQEELIPRLTGRPGEQAKLRRAKQVLKQRMAPEAHAASVGDAHVWSTDAICSGAYPWESNASATSISSQAMPGTDTAEQLITRLRTHTCELHRATEELELLKAERTRCLAYLERQHAAIDAALQQVSQRTGALQRGGPAPACTSFAARQPTTNAQRMQEVQYCKGLELLLGERLRQATVQLQAARQAFVDGSWEDCSCDIYDDIYIDEEDTAM